MSYQSAISKTACVVSDIAINQYRCPLHLMPVLVTGMHAINPPSFNILINPNPYTSCGVPILPNHIIVLTNSNPCSHREPKTYVNLRPPREKIEGRARVMFNKIHVLVMLRSKKSCPEEEEIRTTETMPETLGQNYILIYGWWL